MDEQKIKTLKEIGKEMNSQDNRSTGYPLFVIQTENKIYNENGCDSERKEDIDRDELCESCNELYSKDEDLPEECSDCDSNGFHWFELEYQFDLRAGVFFTEKACQEHLDYNDYHYNKPRIYAVGAWRNSEMQKVMQILSSLGSEDGKVTMPYL